MAVFGSGSGTTNLLGLAQPGVAWAAWHSAFFPVTVGMWINNTSSYPGTAGLWAMYSGSSGQMSGVQVLSTGQVRAEYNVSSIGASSSFNMVANTWYYVAAVFTSTGHTLYVYNRSTGAESITTNAGVTPIVTSATWNSYFLGGGQGSISNPPTTMLAGELAIWTMSAALTVPDLRRLAMAGANPLSFVGTKQPTYYVPLRWDATAYNPRQASRSSFYPVFGTASVPFKFGPHPNVQGIPSSFPDLFASASVGTNTGTIGSTARKPSAAMYDTGSIPRPITGNAMGGGPFGYEPYGVIDISGSISASARKSVSSTTGSNISLPVTATPAGTSRKPTGALSGSAALLATLSSTPRKPVAAVAGTSIDLITGSLSSTPRKPATAFTGTYIAPVIGSLSSTPRKPVASVAGTYIALVTGSLSSTTRKSAASIAARFILPNPGTITATGRKPAATIAAQFIVFATIAGHTRKNAITLSGSSVPALNNAAVVSRPRKARAALYSSTTIGTIAGTSRKPTVTNWSGSQSVNGVIAGTERKSQAAFSGTSIALNKATPASVARKPAGHWTGSFAAAVPFNIVDGKSRKPSAKLDGFSALTPVIGSIGANPRKASSRIPVVLSFPISGTIDAGTRKNNTAWIGTNVPAPITGVLALSPKKPLVVIKAYEYVPITGPSGTTTNVTTAQLLFYTATINAVRPGGATFTFSEGHDTTPHLALADLPDVLFATGNIYVSDSGYRTSAAVDGDPVVYPPLITEAFIVDRRFNLAPGNSSIGAAWGSLVVSNYNNAFSAIAGTWNNDGRPIVISMGNKNLETQRLLYLDPPISTLTPMFSGIQTPWTLDETSLTIPLRDASYWLDRPVQSNLYLGTGGYQGPASLLGSPLPMARGGTTAHPICNVTPVLVDSVANIWQYTDLAGTVVNLYEGGALTITRQSDTTNLYAGTTTAGQYRTDNSRGLFQLGSSPAAAITCDVTGAFSTGTYTTAIALAQHLLLDDLNLPTQYLGSASFAAADAAYPYVAGVYFGSSDSPDGTEAVNQCLKGLGAKLYPDRDGTLKILVLRAPSGTSVATFNQQNASGMTQRPLDASISPPPYRMRIGYSHNYTVQTSGLLGAISAAQRTFVSSADSYSSAASSDVLTNYARPNDVAPITGALLVASDAQVVANALISLWATRRRVYDVTVPLSVGLQRDLGEIVTLTWTMDNLFSGQSGIIIGETFRSTDASMIYSVLV